MATRQQIDQAFVDILGHSPDDMGMAVHVYGDFSEEKVRQLVAASPEAQKKGVDATQFGAVVANRESLTPKQQEYYDVAAQYGSGPIYEHEIKTWAKYGASPEHYQAELQGQIQRDVRYANGKYQTVTTYTQDAIDTMGGKFNLRGYDTGDLILVPQGTSMADLWIKGGKTDTGYQIYQASGELGGGLLGAISDVTGIGEFEDLIDIVPKEIWAAADIATLGNAVGVIGGAEAQIKAYDGVKSLGINVDDYQQFTAYANIAADIALIVASMGAAAPGVAAKRAALTTAGRQLAARNIQRAANQAIIDKDTDLLDFAANVAPAVATAYFNLPIYAEAGIAGVSEYARNGDWTDAALVAGSDVLGQSMGDAFGLSGTLAVDALTNMALGRDTEAVIRSALQTYAFAAASAPARDQGFFSLPSLEDAKNFNLFPNWKPSPDYNFKEDWAKPLTQAFESGALWSDFAAAAMPWNSTFAAAKQLWTSDGRKKVSKTFGHATDTMLDFLYQSNDELQERMDQ